MMRIIIEKDIRQSVLTFRFAAALLTTFVLVIVSVWVLGDEFRKRQNNFTQLSSDFESSLQDIRIPAQLRPVVHREPNLLAIFARGVGEQLGNSVEITRWQIPREATDMLAENKLLQILPGFDLKSVFIYVLSIFGLLMSYDAFTGERQRGTLKMMYANRISLGTVYMSKLISGILVLAVPFIISFISALLVLQFVHGIALSGTQWMSVGFMILIGVAYATLFIALGLLCSTITTRSASSLTLAIFLWTVLVVLVGPVADGIAGLIVPLESPDAIHTLEQQSGDALSTQVWQWRQENAPYAGSGWGVSNVGSENPYIFDAPPDWFKQSLAFFRYYEPLYQQRAEQIWREVDRIQKKKERQASVADMMKALSPTHLFKKGMEALAGTGYHAWDSFLDDARRYRNTMLNSFRDRGFFDRNVNMFISRRPESEYASETAWEARLAEMRRQLESGESGHAVMSVEQFDPLPDTFLPPWTGSSPDISFSTGVESMLYLFAVSVLLIALGIAFFNRYDVR